MTGFGEDNQQKSEFNMAVAWLNRLNYYFYICDDASHNLDSHQWLQTLMILFRELTTEMTEEIRQKWKREARQLFDDLSRSNKQSMRTGQTGIQPDTYWKLNDFEEFLRKTMDNSGLLKKMQDDASKALK